MTENLLYGLEVLLTWTNLLAVLIGVTAGIAVGVLPGLGPSIGVALLVPFTISSTEKSNKYLTEKLVFILYSLLLLNYFILIILHHLHLQVLLPSFLAASLCILGKQRIQMPGLLIKDLTDV